jgi:hypothetical protein
MSALLVGYARCSTDQQDLTAQRDGLLGMGVESERIYVDHGLTGTNRERPGLREALAACRAGDTLVVTKLDRLARSLPDARAIADELTARQISLSLGGSVYDPTDAVGRLLFNVLAMVAEFESDLIRLRTVEACRSPRPRAGFAASSPSSTESRKRTRSPSCTAASTALSRWPSSSASADPPSTAPSNASGWRPWLALLVRHQGAELSLAPAVPDLTPHRDAGAWRLRLRRSQPMAVRLAGLLDAPKDPLHAARDTRPS